MHNVAAESIQNIGVHNLIDPNFTNDWERLIERTLYFLHPSLHKRAAYSESARLKSAENTWFHSAMKYTHIAANKGKLSHLFCKEREGIVGVVDRPSMAFRSSLARIIYL